MSLVRATTEKTNMVTRKNLSRTELNTLYWNMYNRCYGENYLEKNPKYRGCTICEEWLTDKESFYDWASENYYVIDGEQVDLDKDILVKDNKVYSPETCIFAPHIINTYYERLIRNPVKTKNGKYQMSLTVDGKTVSLGIFDTEEEAKNEYIKHKQAAMLAKADLYKDKIPAQLYKAMTDFTIELSDWK